MDSTTSSPQQFCLRWHNHQTSLLSSLPLLLDQSHLTDVTLSAEGKTLRAHRVVLSACSSFFSELFRTLDSSYHPVIVIPGASFGAVVALLTFMYSGEVNVFEEQIPTLLTLAETLGIKGLADFNNSSTKSPKVDSEQPKEEDSPPPQPLPASSSKITSPLENFFMKSFPFYPNLLSQPLNFSQSALNKTTELLAKYQQQCNRTKDSDEQSLDENSNKRANTGEKKSKETKKIDKIAENLRCTTSSSSSSLSSNMNSNNNNNNNNNKPCMNATAPKMPMAVPHSPPTSLALKPPPFPSLPHHFMQESSSPKNPDSMKMESYPSPSYTTPENLSTTEAMLEKTISNVPIKPSNSKLYATCFICHKQLSNQYNLRVHLETHQNVRYACNVCSHVSRSKDALRKHVSYRHPGAPSPCESETRRKRSKGLTPNYQIIKQESGDMSSISQQNLSNQQFMFLQNQFQANNNNNNNNNNTNNNNNNNSQTPTSAPSTPTTPTTPPSIIEPNLNLKKESANSELSDSV